MSNTLKDKLYMLFHMCADPDKTPATVRDVQNAAELIATELMRIEDELVDGGFLRSQ